jgi:hypothetical protein
MRKPIDPLGQELSLADAAALVLLRKSTFSNLQASGWIKSLRVIDVVTGINRFYEQGSSGSEHRTVLSAIRDARSRLRALEAGLRSAAETRAELRRRIERRVAKAREVVDSLSSPVWAAADFGKDWWPNIIAELRAEIDERSRRVPESAEFALSIRGRGADL